jgi:hypothetical protein
VSLLPTPPGYVPPDYTPEQQARYDEVDQYLLNQWPGYSIVEATQGYSGDIFYWVDNNTLPPAYQTAPSWTAEDLIPADGTELGRTELELYPELRSSNPNTTPIQRPDFSQYIMGNTGAASIQDYVDNYQVMGQPSGQTRLYAGLNSIVPNSGVSAVINQFQGEVEPGTFTLIEIAVICPFDGEMQEQVGVLLSRDRKNFKAEGDGRVRLHVEYMTQGTKTGDMIGGFDERQMGFVPYPGRPYGPGGLVPASLPGIGTQVEHRVDITLSSAGDWWIAHNGNWLGYYPAHLFKELNGGACRAAWYAEVYDGTPTSWTWTDVGSGLDMSLGFAYLAYVRNPEFRDLVSGLWSAGDCTQDICFTKPMDTECYSRSTLMSWTPPKWTKYFYVMGDGSDNPYCY